MSLVVFCALWLISGGLRPQFEPGQPAHVGDQVGKAELGRRPGQADRADEQAEPAFLGGEDMLDRDPDPRPGGVAAGDVRRRLAR